LLHAMLQKEEDDPLEPTLVLVQGTQSWQADGSRYITMPFFAYYSFLTLSIVSEDIFHFRTNRTNG
jgi:hypothetical protein